MLEHQDMLPAAAQCLKGFCASQGDERTAPLQLPAAACSREIPPFLIKIRQASTVGPGTGGKQVQAELHTKACGCVIGGCILPGLRK